MTDLIACLTSGKGEIAHVLKLIELQQFDNVFLITDKNNSIQTPNNINKIEVDLSKTIPELSEHILQNLKGRIKGFEVALNVVSGSGKEHMAILSTIIKLGIGFRLVALTKTGVKEI